MSHDHLSHRLHGPPHCGDSGVNSLRIVIQVFDHETMQQPQGSASLVVSEAELSLIHSTTDQRNLAEWASEELGSIISCLKDMAHGT